MCGSESSGNGVVPRLFTQLDSPNEGKRENLPLSNFLSEPALVVLGEPGMGKTTTFVQAAQKEENAECLDIRRFIPPRNPRGLEGKTLYLDGLDEQRAGRTNSNDALDAIIGRLEELGRPKFRLSCRTADWFGELDKSHLRDASSSGYVTVIRLEPLSEVEIRQIVAAQGLDEETFLEQAQQSGIEEWITNPQHLEMILKVVSQGQEWPETRKELFERACLELVREHNDTHRRGMNPSPDNQLMLAAGMLCFLILRANLEGVAFGETSVGEGFPGLTSFSETGLPIVEAARTKLFHHPGPERAAYYHRTMAEYLAACFLVYQINHNGLPASRVKSLLISENGLLPSHLRGLHAWIASLCSEPALSLFLNTDPLGFILYGDPTFLSIKRKEQLLNEMSELAEQDPWFRQDLWDINPFERLADSSLSEKFQNVLSDWQNHQSPFVATILDIITAAKIPIVPDSSLLSVIRDHEAPSYLSYKAVRAYATHYPGMLDKLKSVVIDYIDNKLVDKDSTLEILLTELYPKHLTLEFLFNNISKLRVNNFFQYYLVEKIPKEQLPQLLILLQQNKNFIFEGEQYDSHFYWKELVGQSLVKAIKYHGEISEPEVIWSWFGVLTNSNSFSDYSEKYRLKIQEWFDEHKDVLKNILMFTINNSDPNEIGKDVFRLWRRLQISEPEWFASWCLEQVPEFTNNQEAANALFVEGIKALFWHEPIPPYPLDIAFDFVEWHPYYKDLLTPLLSSDLDENKWIRPISNIAEKAERNRTKQQLIANLTRKIQGIEQCVEKGELYRLAKIYHGRFWNVNFELSPYHRLVDYTSQDIAKAASLGFIKCVYESHSYTPEDIKKLALEGKEYSISYVLLAALELIGESSLLNIPEDTLKSAIAFKMSKPSGREPAWFLYLLKEQPDMASRVIFAYWLPQLQANSEHISDLSRLDSKEWSEIAQRLAIPLLEACPKLEGQSLELLLLAALKWGDHQALNQLVQERWQHVTDQISGWSYLAASAVLLDPAEWAHVKGLLKQNCDRFIEFVSFILTTTNGKLIPLSKLYSQAIDIITIGSKNWFLHSPVAWSGKVYTPTPDDNISDYLRNLVDRIGKDPSPAASNALQQLLDSDLPEDWDQYVRSILATHHRLVADDLFPALQVNDVLNVISNGSPATAGDFQALIIDYLTDIADDLRNNTTDGYKVFWNLDSHGRTANPIPEEDGRDRLLEKLLTQLSAVGISAEPEGHTADDKRVDIKCKFGTWVLPIEIKRDDHDKLWKSPENQLIKQYVRERGTEGYGIYLVFWFGEHGRGLQGPPRGSGIGTPSSFIELETALQKTVPSEHESRVIVKVIDVSTRKPANQ
ncbi:MAG: hypothetical protein HQL54_09935 [Magnetococcales bacterium]|nr:hypothetical protein [Magnetococcales bacterium]